MQPREHEWDARWWSPIINAEHLAMRERAAMFDLTAFCIFDVIGAGRARVGAEGRDAADGRAGRTRRLHAGALAERRLQVRPDDHEDGRRALPRRHRRRARHGRPEVVRRPPRRRRARSRTSPRRGARSASGARARATSSRRSRATTSRTRASRSARGRTSTSTACEVLASRISYVGDLGWELYVPMEHGREALGHGVGGGAAARRRARRHRRLRHDRPAREVLPRVRLRARRGLHRRRGRHGVVEGEGRGLRRQGGARRAPRGGAGREALHADDRRPHVDERHEALPARARAGHAARRHAARRRARPPLVRDVAGRRPVDRQAHPDVVPAAGARERGRAARGRVHDGALPGDGRRSSARRRPSTRRTRESAREDSRLRQARADHGRAAWC